MEVNWDVCNHAHQCHLQKISATDTAVLKKLTNINKSEVIQKV
jgi:hypothetical protein